MLIFIEQKKPSVKITRDDFYSAPCQFNNNRDNQGGGFREIRHHPKVKKQRRVYHDKFTLLLIQSQKQTIQTPIPTSSAIPQPLPERK
jgi:hypothetical protein